MAAEERRWLMQRSELLKNYYQSSLWSLMIPSPPFASLYWELKLIQWQSDPINKPEQKQQPEQYNKPNKSIDTSHLCWLCSSSKNAAVKIFQQTLKDERTFKGSSAQLERFTFFLQLILKITRSLNTLSSLSGEINKFKNGSIIINRTTYIAA